MVNTDCRKKQKNGVAVTWHDLTKNSLFQINIRVSQSSLRSNRLLLFANSFGSLGMSQSILHVNRFLLLVNRFLGLYGVFQFSLSI